MMYGLNSTLRAIGIAVAFVIGLIVLDAADNLFFSILAFPFRLLFG